LPKGTPAPPAPEVGGLNQAARPEVVPENMDPPGDGLVRDAAIDRLVMEAVQRGNAAPALRLIAADRRLSPAYAAQLRAEVAQFLFTHNQDAEALRIAQASLRDLEPRDQPSLGFFIAGLAAWRLDRLDVARTMFEGGADTPLTSPRLHAALAFWASRASRRLHDPVATVKWLQVAAGQPLTLHGFLARRLLRMPTGIVPSGQLLAQADVDAVAATPAGLRAFALFQIGQPDRAEAELRSLWPMARANPVFGRSLLMVAAATGLTDSAAQMAALLQAEDGLRHDELRFPVPRLRPAGGFSVDPALVYALTRLESNFNSGAVSPAGARGLMQIMPATAKYIMGDTLYEAGRLHEPATNLEIGQRYVSLLAKQDGIGGDLIRMLASYNCGPGNFLHWSAAVRDDGDPLLFMEAIPIAETRAFVPTALVYSWIYAARLHLPAPSLDSLAAGEFPRFTPSEQERRMAVLALELN
jgi:soluble lytic murein transglycosylase-like protein